MENTNLNLQNTAIKFEYFMSALACLLFFLVAKDIIPNYIYLIVILAFSFYFMPVRFFRFKFEKDKNEKIMFIISSLIIATILAISIALTYISDSSFFRTIFLGLSLINFMLMIFSYWKKYRPSLYLHFIIAFFTSVVLFV